MRKKEVPQSVLSQLGRDVSHEDLHGRSIGQTHRDKAGSVKSDTAALGIEADLRGTHFAIVFVDE